MGMKKRLYLLLMTVLLVVLAGSTGYYALTGGQTRFVDCIYMTVISLTGVGYGEVIPVTGNMAAQVYTMVLIVSGMGVILYGISTLTALLVEGDLSGMLRKNQMEKRIDRLKDHTIVCGGGETGLPLLRELTANKEDVVLIENDPERIERSRSLGEDLLYIAGDATDDANLVAAGIERARGIVIALPSDKDNLFVTMSARLLNQRVRIVSRMTDDKLAPKLKKAGADRVVSPNQIGALRLASEMIRPTAVDFLDQMLRSTKGNIRIHQLVITTGGQLAGKKLSDSGFRSRYDLLVLGAKEPAAEMVFNPTPDTPLVAGLTLVVMGDVENIARARKSC